MGSADHFFARRVRWRLMGAWRWPLFAVATVADALIAHALPPTGAEVKFVPALIVASFSNLLLIGAIAPWLARRLAARQGHPAPPSRFPPAHSSELLVDRFSAGLLLLATLGLLVGGLGNQKVVIATTRAAASAAQAARNYEIVYAPAEIRRNFESSANTVRLQDSGLFRVCGAYTDQRRAWCMYVDTNTKPPTVRYDHDSSPNPAPTGEGP